MDATLRHGQTRLVLRPGRPQWLLLTLRWNRPYYLPVHEEVLFVDKQGRAKAHASHLNNRERSACELHETFVVMVVNGTLLLLRVQDFIILKYACIS